MDIYISQEIFLIYIQLEQDTSILGEDDNIFENFGPYEDDKWEKQDAKSDHRNLITKSSDTRNCIRDSLLEHTSQNIFLASELSATLKKARLSEQKFPGGKPISDIKYPYLSF